LTAIHRSVTRHKKASSCRQTNDYIGDYLKLQFTGMFHSKEKTSNTGTHGKPEQYHMDQHSQTA